MIYLGVNLDILLNQDFESSAMDLEINLAKLDNGRQNKKLGKKRDY